jgi:tetratricopeptide (TPR) repeat protein
LKPENVMVGEYGEVQVMDWGLAKVLPRKKRKTFARDEGGRMKLEKGGKQELQVSGLSPQPSPGIDSVRGDEVGDVLNTMDGQIMGTPGFMSPEQALGKTEEIDTRTDIYALGAILYNVLTLEVPIKAKNLADLIDKVTSGSIRTPTEYNDKRIQKSEARSQNEKEDESRVTNYVSLVHLPDNRVPESLSAVVMRALKVEAHHRYQTVKELQKEIEAYQSGFATKAEGAGTWRQIQLLVRRHKTATAALVAIAALLLAASWINFRARIDADKARKIAQDKEKVALAKEKEARDTLTELKNTVPALVTQAKAYVRDNDCDRALKTVSYVNKLVPNNAEYWCLRGNILQTLLKMNDAIQAYSEALALDPTNKQANENKKLCGRIRDENKGFKELPVSAACQLFMAMRAQDRFDDAMATIQRIGGGGATIETCLKSILDKAGIKYNRLTIDNNSMGDLDLKGVAISDVIPLKGLPLVSLTLEGTQVSDLSPLKGMSLRSLNITGTRVLDLTPLSGMPLISLNIDNMKINDLTPIKSMPLKYLVVSQTPVNDFAPLKNLPLVFLDMHYSRITDLTPLKDMPLRQLNIFGTRVTDLTPIKGMQLTRLDAGSTRITDLSPLEGAPLMEFFFPASRITNGIEVVRNSKTIKIIGITYGQPMPVAEFWKKYDAGEFKQENNERK